jgi:hypothetical protein
MLLQGMGMVRERGAGGCRTKWFSKVPGSISCLTIHLDAPFLRLSVGAFNYLLFVPFFCFQNSVCSNILFTSDHNQMSHSRKVL